MRVEIERDVPTKRWNIYVIRDGNPSSQWVADAPDEMPWSEITPGERLAPSLIIEDEVWGPLTAAILGLPTDQRPLADHLNDAREVRDRLLAMVEQRWAPRSQ